MSKSTNTAVQKALLAWYDANARDLPWRRTKQPYAIWISEIMCQQTRVSTVIPYYARFLRALPTIEALAEVDEDTLHRLWKGLGYYRRAALLRKGARHLREHWGGELPSSFDALREVPGLGEYTAGAVASIAFGIKVPAVDGNVVRVFSRWLDDTTPADKLRVRVQAGEAAAWVHPKRPGDWNQALMELGATVCTPRNPACNRCPVAKHCAAHAAGTVAERPVKGRATKHVEEHVAVLVFRKGDKVWIEKRGPSGLLAGLWGFPMGAEGRGREVLRYKHVFTHRTWHAAVFEAKGAKPAGTGRWASLEELEQEGIPTAFQPVVGYLTEPDLFARIKVRVR